MLYSLISSCQYFSFLLYVFDVIFILDFKIFLCLYELHSDLKRIVLFRLPSTVFNIAVSHRWRWLKRLVASRGLTPCSRILMHYFIVFLVLLSVPVEQVLKS